MGSTCVAAACLIDAPTERAAGPPGGSCLVLPEDRTMKADIHPNYHMIKVVMTNGDGIHDPFDLWRGGRDAATSTSIRTPIRLGPAVRSSCSIAAAACRASTAASPASASPPRSKRVGGPLPASRIACSRS